MLSLAAHTFLSNEIGAVPAPPHVLVNAVSRLIHDRSKAANAPLQRFESVKLVGYRYQIPPARITQ